MSAPAHLVTVYRSMDEDAGETSAAIRDLLIFYSIAAEIVDDSAPGVPEGTFEVRVPSADSNRAEEVIAQNAPSPQRPGDASRRLDLETVFHSQTGPTSEFEAMNVKNLLESNGITAVLVGDSVLPNLPFEVRVARNKAQLARKLIAQAEAGGRNQSE
ncbi:MAG TPA: hypothetical protein VLW25_13260 [Bryobacteraceae bacterium]|nr:hypothetical protein [Bryobacteraceae bacterium]